MKPAELLIEIKARTDQARAAFRQVAQGINTEMASAKSAVASAAGSMRGEIDKTARKAGTLKTAFGNAFGAMRRNWNDAKSDFASAGRGMLDGIRGSAGQIGGLLKNVGKAAAATGGLASGMALSFDAALTQVEALVGVNRETLDRWKAKIMELADATANSPTSLAQALFVITSAGARGEEAMDVLERSAKASAVGLGDMQRTARALVSAMTAYGKETLGAAEATDVLVATVREGNLDARTLSGTLGQLLPLANQLGVSFADAGAFIATFTRLGVTAPEASFALRSIMQFFLKPGGRAENMLKELGTDIESLRATIRERGVVEALIELRDAAQGDIVTLTKLIPNILSLSGVLGTVGSQQEEYLQITESVRNAQGSLDEAFRKTSESVSFQSSKSWNSLQVLLTSIGESLAPLIRWFTELPGPVQQAAIALGGMHLAAQLGLLNFGGLIGVFPKLLSAARIFAVGLRGLMTLALGPIGLLVAAIVGIGVVLYKFRDEIWDALTGAVRAVADAVTSAYEAVRDALVGVFNWLVGFVSDNWREILGLLGNLVLGPAALIATNAFGIRDKIAEVWDAIKRTASDAFHAVKDTIVGAFEAAVEFIASLPDRAWRKAKQVGEAIADGVWSGIQWIGKKAGNFFIDLMNEPIGAWNWLIDKAGGIPVLGSLVKHARLPEIPRLAVGVDRFAGGLAVVGEQGEELVHMPAGSSVISARDVRELTRAIREELEATADLSETLKMAMRGREDGEDPVQRLLALNIEAVLASGAVIAVMLSEMQRVQANTNGLREATTAGSAAQVAEAVQTTAAASKTAAEQAQTTRAAADTAKAVRDTAKATQDALAKSGRAATAGGGVAAGGGHVGGYEHFWREGDTQETYIQRLIGRFGLPSNFQEIADWSAKKGAAEAQRAQWAADTEAELAARAAGKYAQPSARGGALPGRSDRVYLGHDDSVVPPSAGAMRDEHGRWYLPWSGMLDEDARGAVISGVGDGGMLETEFPAAGGAGAAAAGGGAEL